jgi:hypothetical protein
VTLVVAAWLGFEVHQTRIVERQAETIRALGGEVEFEPSTWSLARFIEPGRFGRRIVTAQVPGDRADEALSLLEAMPYLREVQVAYDGSYDLGPSWSTVRSRLSKPKLVAVALPVVDADDIEPDTDDKESQARWMRSGSKKRYERFAVKVAEGSDWELGMSSPAPEQYQVLCLPDGRLAEVLVRPGLWYRSRLRRSASLLVADQYADFRLLPGHGAISFRDVDGDGRVEVAVEPNSFSIAATRAMNGTAFLELYAIEPTGFRSLLPAK